MARPKNNEIIVGLDIGTSKIAAIVGEVTEDGLDILVAAISGEEIAVGVVPHP